MRRFLAALALTLCVPPAFAQNSSPISAAPPVAGRLPAQAGSGAAVVGKVGEIVSAWANAESISVTISNASPAVVTMTGNTFASRCVVASGSANKCVLPIYFTGLTGTSGVSNSTPYYVDPASISGNTFSIATSVANALAATDVNTTGTDSGTGVAATYIATASTPQPVLAIYLVPGDWDCNGNIGVLGVASTAPTLFLGILGTTPTGSPIFTNLEGSGFAVRATLTTGAQLEAQALGRKQISLSAQTLEYEDVTYSWSGGATNPTSAGKMVCRRAE